MDNEIGCFELYRKLLPDSFFKEINEPGKRGGIFSIALVAWIMIWQRLYRNASMSEAMLRVATGKWSELSGASSRVKHGRISESTGGFSLARSKLSLASTEKIFDELYEGLQGQASADSVEFGVDGTTMILSSTNSIIEQYPPALNQLGAAKNGILHMVVAHNLDLGYAVRPAYGAFFGDKISTEAQLCAELLPRLPQGATIVGDRNFGIFVSCYAMQTNGNGIIVRLTDSRAKKIAGKAIYDGLDEQVEWRMSKAERKKYETIPRDSVIRGRVVCRRVYPKTGPSFLLAIFTSLRKPVEKIIATYGKRWNIELDLRTLKQTVNMESLRAKALDTVAKELLMGIAAYNLIRALMVHCATLDKGKNARYSFTKLLNVVKLFMPDLADAKTTTEREKILKKLLHFAKRATLPNRKRGANSAAASNRS